MEQPNQEQRWIPVDELLRKPPFPPREENPCLDFLVSSVRLHGILSPLLVRRAAGGGTQVVCGHRRLLAAQKAGIEAVPALVAPLEDAQAIRCYLSENMCRQAMTDSTRETALQLLKALRDEDSGAVGEGEARPGRAGGGGWTAASSTPAIAADRSLGEETAVPEESERDEKVLELIDRTEELFREARGRKRIEMPLAAAIVEELLELPEDRRPLRPGQVYRHGGGETWLARHSLLVASLNGVLVPGNLTGLGARGYALAGLLHDVGMVFMDRSLLTETGTLGPKQRRELQSHTRIGHALISAAGKDHAEIALVARDHHERLDGSGYPNGLRGDQLGRLVLVTSLADSYASMVGPRPHRQAMNSATALERLARATEMGLYEPKLFPLLRESCRFPLRADAEGPSEEGAASRWSLKSRKSPVAVEIH